MSNQEFCLYVYNNINIKGICYKIGIWRDTEDIEQIIYETIMKTPNRKINEVWEKKYVLTWVYKVVFNNLDHGEWVNMKKLNIDMDGWSEEDEEWSEEKENKLKFIDNEFRGCGAKQLVRMTQKEQEYYIGKELLKNKIRKRWTLDEMREKFGVGRNAINDIIQETKKELRRRYED